MENSKADALYFEIADAMDLLDNVTAESGSEDNLGLAELALTRAREIMIDQGMLRIFAEAPAMVAVLRDFVKAGALRLNPIGIEARAILSRIDGAGDTLPDAPVPAPTGEYQVRYASTIIRRNAEPRFAVFDSENDLADDLRDYARDVLDLEVSDLADIQELADRIGQETRESVYWGEC